jgi:hypothetical protein
LHRERVLSLSEWELLSVNVNDRDHPLISGRLPLAWNVDRVFRRGKFFAGDRIWKFLELCECASVARCADK